MAKYILLLLLTLSRIGIIQAQNARGSTNDIGRIVLNSYLPDDASEGMPSAAGSVLKNKLGLIASANGLGGSASNPQFIITAHVAVLTKEITPTAPPMIALVLEITFYIGDGIAGTKFSSKSIELKGVGENETKAYISALKTINPNNPALQKFAEEGKEKILQYYNSKCDFIITDAKGKAARSEYDAAISSLLAVPEVCKECYEKCTSITANVYKEKLEKECSILMAKAKSLKAQNAYDSAASVLSGILPTVSCYKAASAMITEIENHRCSVSMGAANGAWSGGNIEETMEYLQQVSSDSKCAADAKLLAEKVRVYVKEKEKRDWNFMLKQHDDETDITKRTISAARDIGVAYGKNQPRSVSYKISSWW